MRPSSTIVLVVEDDLHTAKILERILTRDRMLRHLRIEVVIANDGEEGLKAFVQRQPALVITDLLMPRMDGFELVRRLRAEEAGKDVPILATSAVFRESSDLRRLQVQHRVEFQPKPFSPHAIAQRVQRLLRPPPSERRAPPAAPGSSRPPAQSGPAPSPRPVADSRPAGERPDEAAAARPTRDGDLSQAPLARVLLEAFEGQWTGEIDLLRGKVQKVIYLLAGHPIFVQSNLRAETLGQLLLRRGGLTEEQSRSVLAEAQQHGIKYGEALVKLKLMSETEVMAELVAQTRFKLENCLRWPEGRWSYAHDPDAGRKVPHCTVDPVDVVFSGLRSSFDVEETLARLGEIDNAGGRIDLASRFESYRDQFVRVFGDHVLREIVAGCSLSHLTQRSTFAHAVLQVDVLHQCGLVDFSSGADALPVWAEPAESLPLHHLTLPAVSRPPTDDGIEIVVAEPAGEAADSAGHGAPSVDIAVVTPGPPLVGGASIPEPDVDLGPIEPVVGGASIPEPDVDLGPVVGGASIPEPDVDLGPVVGGASIPEPDVDLGPVVGGASIPEPDWPELAAGGVSIPEPGVEDLALEQVDPGEAAADVAEAAWDAELSAELELEVPDRADGPAGAPLPWQGPPRPPAASVARPMPPPEELEIARQLIDSFYLGLHDADHYQVLGVIPDTDQFSVEVAYQIKRKQFNLERYRGMDLGESYGHLEQIIARLDEAFATIADPVRRAAYDRACLAARRAPASAALSGETFFRQGETLFAEGRYEEAAEAYGEAARLDEQGIYVARDALARFMAAGQTPDAAVEAMALVQQVLAAEPEQTAAHMAAAAITRLLGDDEESLRHLQAVLRIDPLDREAFDGLEAVLVDLRRIDELEVHFRRTIHLVGDRDPGWTAELWRRLVLLYRDQLADPAKARVACETALRLRPKDARLRRLLEELGGWPDVVLGLRSLLRSVPEDATPLHRIFELHRDAGRLDAAYVAASAAVLRGDASEEEQDHHRRHAGATLQRTRGRISLDDDRLRHPDDDRALAELFGVLWPLIERRHPRQLSSFGLSDDDLLSEPPPQELNQMLAYTCGRLELQLPQVVVRGALPEGARAVATTSPLLLVDPTAPSMVDPLGRCFCLCRQLVLLAPRNLAIVWQPEAILRDHLIAALAAVDDGLAIAGQPEPVRQLVQEIAAVEGEARTRLDAAARELVRRRIDPLLLLLAGRRGVLRSADRAALLLCTDLVAAGRVLADICRDSEALADVVDFALGAGYGELRAELGLAHPTAHPG